MKLDKPTYTIIKKANALFKYFYLTRLNIISFNHDQYSMFRFKYSKIEINYIKVFIILAIIQNYTYIVIIF